MVEFTEEPKSVYALFLDLGWELAAFFFLCCGAIGIIYGDYAEIPRLTTVGIVALILATYCEIKNLGRRVP